MTEAVYADERLPLDILPESFRRHVDEASPPPMRLMAAQALVPMPPGTLVTALFMLTTDPDDRIAGAARTTLADLPPEVLKPALSERLDVRVLDHLAERYLRNPSLLDAIIMNPATADETVQFIATKAKERQLELISSNQVRLLRHPGIIEALYMNPQTRMSTVDRVIDFAVRAGVYLAGIPAFKEACEALGLEVPKPGGAPEIPIGLEPVMDETASLYAEAAPSDQDSVFASILTESLEREAMAADGLAPDELSDLESQFGGDSELEGYDGEAPEQEDEVKRGRAYEINQMPVSGKIRLALLGTKEDRTILIRDRTRLVALSVIKSPKVNVSEAASYASMRNVDDAVIHYIANKREWMKSYRIKLELARNPKTPTGTALKLLVHLRKPDLRSVASSKGVSHVVAAAAKKRVKGA